MGTFLKHKPDAECTIKSSKGEEYKGNLKLGVKEGYGKQFIRLKMKTLNRNLERF